MVVNEPQKPIAINNEYFASKLNDIDRIEKSPKIKLPNMLTVNTFTGKVAIVIGDSTIL